MKLETIPARLICLDHAAQCTSPSTSTGKVRTGDGDVPERLQEGDTGSPQHRRQKECQDSPQNVTLEGEYTELENQIENLDTTDMEFPEAGQDSSPSNSLVKLDTIIFLEL